MEGDPIQRFLLMEHADRFDLPKGHVDPGETEYQCALRELVEETGITADDITVDPSFRFSHDYTVKPKRFQYEACQKTLVIFLARLKRPVEIQLTEHIGYRWVNWTPPHKLQSQTIDPLLNAVEVWLQERE